MLIYISGGSDRQSLQLHGKPYTKSQLARVLRSYGITVAPRGSQDVQYLVYGDNVGGPSSSARRSASNAQIMSWSAFSNRFLKGEKREVASDLASTSRRYPARTRTSPQRYRPIDYRNKRTRKPRRQGGFRERATCAPNLSCSADMRGQACRTADGEELICRKPRGIGKSNEHRFLPRYPRGPESHGGSSTSKNSTRLIG